MLNAGILCSKEMIIGENMVTELTIVLKDEERTLKQKFLIYEAISLCDTDPVIQNSIKETMKNFVGEPEHITVRALMVVK